MEKHEEYLLYVGLHYRGMVDLNWRLLKREKEMIEQHHDFQSKVRGPDFVILVLI